MSFDVFLMRFEGGESAEVERQPVDEVHLRRGGGGRHVIVPGLEGNPLILVSEAQAKNVPPALFESFRSIVVRSAGDLGAVLSGRFEGWSAYRDHVSRQSEAESEA